MDAYTGEKDEEAVFSGVLVPVAEEYGISVSYEEFKDYISNLANADEMNKEELMQVAGGKGGGFGAGYGHGVGIDWGGAGGAVGCFVVGHGTKYCCIGEGDPHGDTCK